MVNRSSWTADLPAKRVLVLLENLESACLTCPLEMLCSIRASYFLPTASCCLMEAGDKSITVTFSIKKMLDVLLVLYVDLQHLPLQVFFCGYRGEQQQYAQPDTVNLSKLSAANYLPTESEFCF